MTDVPPLKTIEPPLKTRRLDFSKLDGVRHTLIRLRPAAFDS
jgi:hypothetical protein